MNLGTLVHLKQKTCSCSRSYGLVGCVKSLLMSGGSGIPVWCLFSDKAIDWRSLAYSVLPGPHLNLCLRSQLVLLKVESVQKAALVPLWLKPAPKILTQIRWLLQVRVNPAAGG